MTQIRCFSRYLVILIGILAAGPNAAGEEFRGKIGRTEAESKPYWPKVAESLANNCFHMALIMLAHPAAAAATAPVSVFPLCGNC